MEQSCVICRDVYGPRDVIQSEVSKSERKKQILYINTYICGIYKNDIDDLIYKTIKRNRHREQMYGYQGEGEVG